MLGGGDELDGFCRYGYFVRSLEEDAAFFRVDEGVQFRAFSAEPKMLDGMGIRRLFIGPVGLVKAE